MRIESVKFFHPSTLMTNEEVVDIVRHHSKPVFEDDLERALEAITYMLESTGLKTRYWMKDESPLELICEAAHAAMAEAKVEAKDIDLLIFCGISRGFLEPGDSYFVAQALSMDHVTCFDIMDACMSWSRACDIVDSYFQAGRYDRALLVNAESYFDDNGVSFPSNFILRNYRAIEYCFGAYVGGDGATATILAREGGKPWERHYMSTKRWIEYCTVPLPGYEKRSLPSPYIGHNGLGAFTSYGSKVFECYPYMIDILKQLAPRYADIKTIFAHTGGDVKSYEKWATAAGAGGKISYLYPEYGNLGSASIPASIAVYEERGKIVRGDTIGAWIGSSGMSFTAYALEY